MVRGHKKPCMLRVGKGRGEEACQNLNIRNHGHYKGGDKRAGTEAGEKA